MITYPVFILLVVGLAVMLALIAWKWSVAGVILAPFATIAGFTLAAITEDVFVAVMALLIWPLMTGIVCLCSQSSPLETPWYKTLAKLLLIAYTYTAILVLMGFLFNFFGGLLFILLVIGIIRYTQVCKYAGVLEVISTIGLSMRQSLPLPMALQTAAHGQSPKAARIIGGIAYWLTQGYSLSDSIRRGYRKFPPDVLAKIAVGERLNQLPNAIETIRNDISEKVNDYKRIRPVHPWYPLIVLVFLSIMLLGLMFFIVPTFAEVLADMSDGKAGLPWITQKLLNISNGLISRNGFNFLCVLLLMLFAFFYLIYIKFHKRNPQKPRLLSCLGDWLKWHLPIVHWFEKDYSQLQLTELLKIGLRAGHPVNHIVLSALGLDLNYCYRSRIRQWHRHIEQGENISESAIRSGIGRMIAWAMDGSLNKANAPVILESLEEVYRSRYNYRLNLLNAIVCPLMVVGLGCVVGFVVLGMFLPMVKMIQVML